MSYCRFSSDDWACMLYVYESGQGFEVHVASNKPVGPIPKTPELFDGPDFNMDEYMKAHNAQMEFLDGCERENIGLPYDGESYLEHSLEDLLARVTMLKEVGYHVPDFVFESISDEMAEES